MSELANGAAKKRPEFRNINAFTDLPSYRLPIAGIVSILHRISGFIATNAKPADAAGLELAANAGDIYVAKCEVEPQLVGAIVKFTPVALEHARADLQKITKMVVPDVPEI